MSKTNAAPLVSVVVTCYNYGKYVAEAIESVFAQSYENIELIVINDGSSDNSDSEINRMRKKRPFKYISRGHRGVVATRNEAIAKASGQYVMQLDADDTIPSGYVKKMLRVATEKNADIVYADYKMFGDETGRSAFPNYDFDRLKEGNFINISCLIRRAAIRKQRFDEHLSNRTHEDWDFFLGLCAAGCTAIKCQDTVLNYRIHGNARNNTLGSATSQRQYVEMYCYVIEKYAKRYPEQFDLVKLIGTLFADVFGAAYEAQKQENGELRKQNNALNTANNQLRQQNNALGAMNNKLQQENSALVGSISWRITAPLRKASKGYKILKKKAKR
ncbi:hypothetical protein CSA80_03575 [Candidatus Saccharibacteria bacterium]|nr:MAG: hypothetical protein CSA80_03575 [Candidatus Saccharibacteria bacterium]